MKELSRAPMCGTGLADGHRQWRQVQDKAEPRGETQRQAQSEREKRGLRHSDQGVASSSQRSGDNHSTRSANATARLGQARSWRHGDRPWSRKARGWSSYAFCSGSLNQQRPLRTTAREPAMNQTPLPKTMTAIAVEVAQRHDVPYAEMVGGCLKRQITEARQEAMWLMFQVTWSDGRRRHNKRAIGRFFGHADHTSAWHGIRQHERRLAEQEQAA